MNIYWFKFLILELSTLFPRGMLICLSKGNLIRFTLPSSWKADFVTCSDKAGTLDTASLPGEPFSVSTLRSVRERAGVWFHPQDFISKMCNPSTWEVKARGSGVWDQPKLQEILSNNISMCVYLSIREPSVVVSQHSGGWDRSQIHSQPVSTEIGICWNSLLEKQRSVHWMKYRTREANLNGINRSLHRS